MAGTDYVSLKSSDLLLCCLALTELHKAASCFHGKSWGLGFGLILEGRMLDVVDMKKLNFLLFPHLTDHSRRAETVVPSHQEFDSSFPEAWTRNCHASALPGHCSETREDTDEDTDVQ